MLNTSRAGLDKDTADVAAMFDGVATRYDLLNTLMTGGLDRWWRHECVRAVAPQPGERVLDLAAGTGVSSVAYAKAGAQVFPTDLSFEMLRVGKKQHEQLAFTNADGLTLPFADEVFDAVTISYGLRNIADTHGALVEMLRVTKPGGRIVINEFSHPTVPGFKQLYQHVALPMLPKIAAVSSNPEAYEYLVESIVDWRTQAQLADVMTEAGWQRVEWKNLTGGIVALHRGQKAA